MRCTANKWACQGGARAKQRRCKPVQDGAVRRIAPGSKLGAGGGQGQPERRGEDTAPCLRMAQRNALRQNYRAFVPPLAGEQPSAGDHELGKEGCQQKKWSSIRFSKSE